MSFLRLSLFSFALACGDKTDDTAQAEVDTSVSDNTTEDSGDVEETSVCDEAYSFCGDILIPSDMVGTPRSMAISLYETLIPAGPPNVVVTEIAAPEVVAGEAYRIEFSPLIETGEYYLFVFLYMEGGGEWAPVSGIDYVGHTTQTITFDGSPITFPNITVEMAE